MTAVVTDPVAALSRLVAGHADDWDRAGRLPTRVARELGAAGVLCAQVPARHGGPGWDAVADGRLTAQAGELCSSTRSLMTSQGMVAWAVTRWGEDRHQARFLPPLTGGSLAGVAFSEEDAGSDLSGVRTEITHEAGRVRVTGRKVWVTGAVYADLVLVLGRYAGGTALVLVPTDAPGVTVLPRPDPVGCRAAGHADVVLDDVLLDEIHLLPGAGAPFGLPAQSVLLAGRISVAWGCLGIIRACLRSTARHAATRRQSGVRLAEHQLVARRLGEMVAAEQAVLRVCEHAAAAWRDGSPDLPAAALVAKHEGATRAAGTASSAMQVLASAAARDGHPVARAYRDAKLMEIIEGSTEICQLELADAAVREWT
jgi:methoxymalonate biosynthesis protein